MDNKIWKAAMPGMEHGRDKECANYVETATLNKGLNLLGRI
jgi:hypothetical protein